MASLKQIKTPDFGGAAEVTVIEILVNVGDDIKIDAPIITLESDKATMELPATESGLVKEIKVKVGDKVTTGDVLFVLEGAAEKKSGDEKASNEKDKVAKPAEKDKEPSIDAKASQLEKKSHDLGNEEQDEENEFADINVHAGPNVRRLAREVGLDLNLIKGTGPKNRILKEDLQNFVKQKIAAADSGGGFNFSAPDIDFSQFGAIESKSLSRLKKLSGKNLHRNWVSIPHVTQFGEADISDLEEFRQLQKEELAKQQLRLTPLVFIMKAAVASLKAFPNFNASLDKSGEQLILKKYFHIGIAVDTPDGLVVPVIRDVDQKGLIDLAQELAKVSDKARKKQLLPNDMQGGSFSISSLGGIGGTAFTPIINAPEVAILGVSKSFYKPIYQNDKFIPRLTLPLSLSYDHRVIDGAEGARFMMHFISMLSDIRNMLL